MGTTFWKWTGFVYSLLLLVSIVLSVAFLGADWNWGLALFLALVLYTIASFRVVGPQELGARIFLGKPLDNISSGLVFVPWGFFKLKTDTRLIIQKEFPCNPQDIFHAPKENWDGVVPDGKKPPIRITFGAPKETTENGLSVLDRDPLQMRLTEEVTPVVRYKITDYVKFLTSITTTEEASDQLEDLCVSVLSEEFGKVTPDEVIGDYEKYNDILLKELQTYTDTWGITLQSGRVKVISLSHDLNSAMQTIAEETAKGKALVIKEESLKKALTLKGEGAGAAEKAVLTGRTEGLKNMMSQLGIEGHAVLAAETARGITNNPGQKTIIAGSGGFKDLAVIGTVLGESLAIGKEAKNVV